MISTISPVGLSSGSWDGPHPAISSQLCPWALVVQYQACHSALWDWVWACVVWRGVPGLRCRCAAAYVQCLILMTNLRAGNWFPSNEVIPSLKKERTVGKNAWLLWSSSLSLIYGTAWHQGSPYVCIPTWQRYRTGWCPAPLPAFSLNFPVLGDGKVVSAWQWGWL